MVALLNNDRRRGLREGGNTRSRADDINYFIAKDDAFRSAVLGSILKETHIIVTTVHYELKSILNTVHYNLQFILAIVNYDL